MNNSIKKIRLRIGVSQAELARAIGRKQSAIANYESGYRKPDQETAYALIDFANKRGVKVMLEDIYPRPRLLKTVTDKP